jgi:hypothetical protein
VQTFHSKSVEISLQGTDRFSFLPFFFVDCIQAFIDGKIADIGSCLKFSQIYFACCQVLLAFAYCSGVFHVKKASRRSVVYYRGLPDIRYPRWFGYGVLCGLVFLWAGCTQPIALPLVATPNFTPVSTFTPTPAPEGEAPAETEMTTALEAVTTPEPPGLPMLTIGLDSKLPELYHRQVMPLLMQLESVETERGPRAIGILDRPAHAAVTFALLPMAEAGGLHLKERFYAAVVPFATVSDETSMEALAARWRGDGEGLLVVSVDHLADLTALFGRETGATVLREDSDSILSTLEANPGSIGIVAFEELHPRYKVLEVDGYNVLSNQLDAAAYPLAVALTVQGEEAALLTSLLAPQMNRNTNRDPGQLTTLIMTGVTAMSRVTALRMDQRGYTYPALVISDTLSAADITHISNEVPFLDNCVANPTLNNLVLCSHTNYWATLEAIGTDIVGLSGNHVNDFGRDGARRSINWYRENDIAIYGSGMNVDEACEPLLWEHNGNRFAFFAALAFYPEFAWATAEQPGACYYFTNKQRIFDRIAELRGEVDIIAVELQHTETYNAWPIESQIADFRELRNLGVDIVTGVQSHVPQAMEPYAPDNGRPGSIVVYGLGNLFFDQMWSWETRTNLIARHAIYNGRLLSTEILTTVLEDYAQPRWATPEERAGILQRIFNAAPPRPN